MKWYEKPLVIILLLILFFPIGLFLMWKYTNWHRNVKVVLSIVLIFFGGYVVGTTTAQPVETASSVQEQAESDVEVEAEKKDAAKAEKEANEKQKEQEKAAEAALKAQQEAEAKADQAEADRQAQAQAAAEAAAAQAEADRQAQEQAAAQQQQQQAANQQQTTQNTELVYFTPKGKSYHSRQSCSTLNHSPEILSGTLQVAQSGGHGDPCDVCW